MKILNLLLLLALISGLVHPVRGSAPEAIDNFRLMNHQGESFELFRHKKQSMILLLAVAPGDQTSREAVEQLKRLQAEGPAKNALVWLLNVDASADRARIAEELQKHPHPYAVLLDPAQLVADALGFTRTGEFLLIQPGTWLPIYRGGFGAANGVSPGLAKAINDFVTHGTLASKGVPATGSSIQWREEKTSSRKISYVKEVSPILMEKCVDCHKPGDIGPFVMNSYDRVRGWSATIRETLLQNRMPPWHADPHFGAFRNSRGLTPAEAVTLMKWIEQGCPRGEGEDPLLAVNQIPVQKWPFGEPDMVIQAPEQKVPANGLIPYRHLTVEMPVNEDVWIRGAVMRPSNRKILHHAFVFLKRPGQRGLAVVDPVSNGYLTGYVPGTKFIQGLEGDSPEKSVGKLIPKGTKLVFELHYTASGKEEVDQTELGLYVYKTPPRMELISRAAANFLIFIPPGNPHVPMEAFYRFDRDVHLYEMTPHMHTRGKWMKYEALFPDGTSEVLLSVPHYDFNWQHQHWTREPKLLPKGTRLKVTGAFDNSEDNPFNINPKAWARFGLQTTDEMFMGFFHFAQPAP